MAAVEIQVDLLKLKQQDFEFLGKTSIRLLCKVAKACLNNVDNS
jgi:hypothetical protein